MAIPVREQIHAAAKVRLETIAAPAGLKVYRNKTTDFESSPALAVNDGDQVAISDSTQCALYDMTVAIVGQVQSKDELLVGGLLTDLYAAVVKVLFADVSLGGLADDMLELNLEVDLIDSPDSLVTAQFKLSLSIKYATRYGDPTTRWP